MANNVITNGTSCYLKDRNGNILMPKTNAGLVLFEDGETLDEKVANIVDANNLFDLKEQITELKNEVDRLNFDIGSTNNYYKLKSLNNESGEMINELISIKNNIAYINDLQNNISNIENRLLTLTTNLEKLQNKILLYIDSNELLMNQLQEQVTKLEKSVNDFPEGKIVNIEKIEIKDDKNILINSLLASTDMYEYMCSNIDGFINKEVKSSIIDAYVALYKLEVKRISDMPNHIQNLVMSKLI